MFRENTLHRQEKLFNNLSGMDPRYKKRLEKSWAGLFYQHIFSKIDEKLFAPLYSIVSSSSAFKPSNIVPEIVSLMKTKCLLDIETQLR